MSRRATGGFSIARVYESEPGAYRVLVDRLWPRGLTKDDAALDEWAKDVAPSGSLRRWYGHDPSRFEAFAGGIARSCGTHLRPRSSTTCSSWEGSVESFSSRPRGTSRSQGPESSATT